MTDDKWWQKLTVPLARWAKNLGEICELIFVQNCYKEGKLIFVQNCWEKNLKQDKPIFLMFDVVIIFCFVNIRGIIPFRKFISDIHDDWYKIENFSYEIRNKEIVSLFTFL